MDGFFLSQQYEFIQRITEQMLAESELNNWQRVFELEQQRTRLLAELSSEQVKRTLSAVDAVHAEKIRQCIQTILQANETLDQRAGIEKINAQKNLKSSSISSQLNRTYS